jgi:hypothetical protein
MRTLSSLQRRKVETESGCPLGRCYDLRGELTDTKLRVTGLCVGPKAWLSHLGVRSHDRHRDPLASDRADRPNPNRRLTTLLRLTSRRKTAFEELSRGGQWRRRNFSGDWPIWGEK